MERIHHARARLVAILVVVAFAMSGCIHTHCPDGGGGACGDLLLGNNCVGGRAAPQRSHWQLYTGIAVEGAALVAAGFGGAHMVLADKRRASARGGTGIGEKAYLLDQAESHERIAAWSFGAAAPLALLGAAFMIADLVIKDPVAQKRGAENTSGDVRVVPALDLDGGMGLLLRVDF